MVASLWVQRLDIDFACVEFIHNKPVCHCEKRYALYQQREATLSAFSMLMHVWKLPKCTEVFMVVLSLLVCFCCCFCCCCCFFWGGFWEVINIMFKQGHFTAKQAFGKIFHWFRCQRSEFTIKWNIVANDQGCIGKDILCSFVDVLPVHYVTVSTVDSLSWILFRLWPTSCHCQPIVFPHYTTASLCEVFSVTPVTYFLSLPAYSIPSLHNGFSLQGTLSVT